MTTSTTTRTDARSSGSSSSLMFGIVTLLLVVLGSSFAIKGAAASTVTNTEDEEPSSEKNTCENPHYHPKDESLLLYHFESTTSTQDEAKKIVQNDDCFFSNSNNPNTVKAFCVTAAEQTNGRGTSGRLWLGARGNTFVTIGIPQEAWMKGLRNVPLTLLPLRIGSIVASRVQALLEECGSGRLAESSENTNPPMVTVKWPNDVLVDEKKISGVLIESSMNGWFLIGIGVNLAYAPPVPASGPNNGRASTCIQDFCPPSELSLKLEEGVAQQLGVDLAHDLHEWMQEAMNNDDDHSSMEAESVLKEWKEWVDWDMELIMRDTPNHERVRMVDILPDGRVQVVGQEDGLQRTLVSDYFL